jgi:hypothetical protein
MHAKLWLEHMEGRDHSEELGVDGKILQCILGKVVQCGLDSSGSE